MEDSPFDRPTDRVRKIVPMAREHAARLGHAAVEPGHLLLALLEEGSGVASNVLRNAGVDVAAFRARIEAALPAAGGAVGPKLPLTPGLRVVLEASVMEAGRLGHDHIGSEHLLLGLAGTDDPAGGRLLSAAGLDLETARRHVREFLGEPREGGGPRLHPRIHRVFSKVHGLAYDCGHDAIDVEHVLLALLENHDEPARKLFATLGIEPERVRDTTRSRLGHGAAEPIEHPLPLTPRCQAIVSEAFAAATALGHDRIDLAHLLLAILKSQRGIAATTLQEEGLQISTLEQAACEMCQPGSAGDPTRGGTRMDAGQLMQRMTEHGRFVMSFARATAQRLHHDTIRSEHVLAGLVEERAGVPAHVLRDLGADAARLRPKLDALAAPAPDVGGPERLPFSEHGKRILVEAIGAAQSLGHRYLGAEHLLLGLTAVADCGGAALFRDLGLDLDRIRSATLRQLGAEGEAGA